MSADLASTANYLVEIIAADVAAGKYSGRVQTRFPPEPNGYLHIGHLKAMSVNFDLAKQFGGECFLRFDDTNPVAESEEYTEAILRDLRWIGFTPKEIRYTSDYFDELYAYALGLIESGQAYVDLQSPEQVSENRGAPGIAGTASSQRDNSVQENLDLFMQMNQPDNGKVAVLRAKIDMGHANLLMRDPILYRCINAPHHRTGKRWNIYPLYDFAHPLSDAIEGTTHSFCTLEFANNRDIYDWLMQACKIKEPPYQYEYARLEIAGQTLSKRKLAQWIIDAQVASWDDPRLHTLSALRKRVLPVDALLEFVRSLAITKSVSEVSVEHLQFFVRRWGNEHARRLLAIKNPLQVIIDNWDERDVVALSENKDRKDRKGMLSEKIYIDQADYRRDRPEGYRRLAIGQSARLFQAFDIEVVSEQCDDQGRVVALHCNLDWQSGDLGARRLGVLQWLSAQSAQPIVIIDFDFVGAGSDPAADTDELAPPAQIEYQDALLEGVDVNQLRSADQMIQFMRLGYYGLLPAEQPGSKPIFVQAAPLKSDYKI